jgi:hypothetical protein
MSEQLLLLYFLVQPGFLGKQLVLGFNHIRIGDATINGTHRRALRFLMKSRTLRTFA